MAGNTSDRTTVKDFLAKIEKQYGKARRTWVMDRGVPTEAVLAEMRAAETPVHYLAGAPRGRLTLLEQSFLAKPWSQAREQVQVKLVERDGEVYVLARSHSRRDKERAMRRRRLKHPIKRLKDIRNQKRLTRTKLLMKLGAAQHAAGNAYSILDIHVPKAGQRITAKTFTFTINRQKLREARRREGSYLLRSNLTHDDPEKLWLFYLQLVEVEQAFKELKNDLSVRPIYHQLEHRIEAHIFIAFMAYCLQVTLKQDTKALAPGLTPRAAIEKKWPRSRRSTFTCPPPTDAGSSCRATRNRRRIIGFCCSA